MAALHEPEGADNIPDEVDKLTEAEERYLAGEPAVEGNAPQPQPEAPPPQLEAEPENVVANDDDTLSEAGDEGINPAPEPEPEPQPNVTFADQHSDVECNARWRRGRVYTWPEVSTGPSVQSRRTLLQLVDDLAMSLGHQDLDAFLSEPKGRGTVNPYIPKYNVFIPEMRMWITPVRIAPQKATTYVMAPRNKPPYNNTELTLDAIYTKKGMDLRQPQLNLVYCGIWGNWPLERCFVGQGAKLEKKARQESINQPVRDQPSTSGTQAPAPRPPPTSVRCNQCGNRVKLPRSA